MERSEGWRSARAERRYYAGLLRSEGRTWAEIASTFRSRYGVNARLAMRWAHDWSQQQVADLWSERWTDDPKTADNISTWERWPESGHEPSLRTLARLAQIYQCNAADLIADYGEFAHLDAAHLATGVTIRATSERVTVESDSNDHTDRRHFTQASFLTLLGFTRAGQREPPPATTRVVGREHVALVEDALARIELQDATIGGNHLVDAVSSLHDEVSSWLHHRSYAVHAVGEDLQSMLGELAIWRGWLAFDAEQPALANTYLQEALLQSRLSDDPALEVRALSYLCLLLRDKRPRDSLQCAQTAQRLARGWATPRLSALLHLRSARAYATMDERKAFGREMAKARTQLDKGRHEDDPLYVQFVTEHEAIGITGLSFLAMGDPARAAREFQRVVDNPEPDRRRNAGYYTVRLADATLRNRDITGASTIASASVPLVLGLDSRRTTNLLASLHDSLTTYRTSVPAARDFTDLYRETFPE